MVGNSLPSNQLSYQFISDQVSDMLHTMSGQRSDPFCLSLPEWTTCCQEDRLRVNIDTASSEAFAADTAVNDKCFNSFLTADEAEKIAVGYIPKNTEKTK